MFGLQILAKPLQIAIWSLLTAYRNLPTVQSPTPYGHLFSQNSGYDALPFPAKNCVLPGIVGSATLATAGLLVYYRFLQHVVQHCHLRQFVTLLSIFRMTVSLSVINK